MYIFPLLSYVCICVYVCLRERKNPIAGTEKWVEVCGKPCRTVFVWLGLRSRGCFSEAPDNVGLTFANILSSCSGDRLNWGRLARVFVSYETASTLCERLFGVWI